jgi:hypothetical protein
MPVSIPNYSYSGHRVKLVYSAHRVNQQKTSSKSHVLVVGSHSEKLHDVLNTDT